MPHQDPPQDKAAAAEGRRERRKIPIYLLAIVGIFLLALLFYMASDTKPDASDAPPGHPDAPAQPVDPNTPGLAESKDTATAVDQ